MPNTFCTKLFEITVLLAVASACKVKVKDYGDLLLLLDWLFEELGAPYMWIVRLSVVDWEHLTTDHKDLHHTMCDSWLSSDSKASQTVLQHWLSRFLQKQTHAFAPLHKVFAKIKVDSPDSGTSAWTKIFLVYPVTGVSIAHNLLFVLFHNGELNLLLPGSGCPLQTGTGQGRSRRAPGRCGCVVTSLLLRDCGGAVC
jgi:hypothetical protein